MIVLDGSTHEGGGQMLRMALSSSILTKKPFEMHSIRSKRTTPGLKSQHSKIIEAILELSDSKAKNYHIGSDKVEFYPSRLKSRTLMVDMITAGSITLFLQALWLPLAFADGRIKLKIKGGSDVAFSPTYDYMENVFLPQIKPYFSRVKLKLIKRGYYPKGQGEVEIVTKPLDSIPKIPIEFLQPRPWVKVIGVSSASSLLRQNEVAERQAIAAKKKIGASIRLDYSQTDFGSSITLWSELVGASALGEVSKRSEQVGAEAAYNLLGYKSIAVDPYLADQLMPLMALNPNSKISTIFTNHQRSNAYVLEKFFGIKFTFENNIITSSSQ